MIHRLAKDNGYRAAAGRILAGSITAWAIFFRFKV